MAKRNSRWIKISGLKCYTCFGKWELRDQPGYLVRHCGHPTAIWPYYGTLPDGKMILAPNGRGFARLAEAQATMEALADAL